MTTMVELNLRTWGSSAQLLILSSKASSYRLDLQVPLSNEDSDVLFGSLASDQGISSNDEIVRRMKRLLKLWESDCLHTTLGKVPV